MQGPYLENHEMKSFNEMLTKHISSSTLGCWTSTRLRGGSASLSCDGNVSIDLLKLFDKIYELTKDSIENPKLTPYEQGKINVKNDPEPEGQKFDVGSRVRIFTRSANATVLHTYAHAYGGSDAKSYCLDIDGKGSSAWYKESQLTQI